MHLTSPMISNSPGVKTKNFLNLYLFLKFELMSLDLGKLRKIKIIKC